MTNNYTPVDKNIIKKGGFINGSFRAASPQRQFKREERRKHLKQQRQAKPRTRGFG